MQKISQLLLFSLLVLFIYSANAANFRSPIGYWQTVDDVSGKAKSIVYIFPTEEGRLAGKVVKLYQEPDKLCAKCTGSKKNQPILGMVVIDSVKLSDKKSDLWTDGHILDPKNGKTYRCNLQISKDGQELLVRGYMGLPLLGRSQIWSRIDSLQKT